MLDHPVQTSGVKHWQFHTVPSTYILIYDYVIETSYILYNYAIFAMDFPGGLVVESNWQCRRRRQLGFSPQVGKIPWRRKWHPTPVFLPGESHGQRSLAGYRPWGHKESDTAEHEHKTAIFVLKYKIYLGYIHPF